MAKNMVRELELIQKYLCILSALPREWEICKETCNYKTWELAKFSRLTTNLNQDKLQKSPAL